MRKISLDTVVVAENEIAENFLVLSNWVVDNFDQLWIGAKRLKNVSGLSLILEDCWAPKRIQFGNVRFHKRQGVKRTTNLNHRDWELEDIVDDDVLEVYDKILLLLNAAETPVLSKLKIIIEK